MSYLGDEFRLWRDTSANNGTAVWGSGGGSTWVRCDDIGDMEFDRAPKSVEIPKRGTLHTKYKQGRFDRRFTVAVNYTPTDGFCAAIESAIANRTHLHLALTDSDVDISDDGISWTIYHADYVVVGNPLSAPLDDGATFDVEFAPWSDSVNEPVKETFEP